MGKETEDKKEGEQKDSDVTEKQWQDNHRANSRGIAWINRPGPFIKS